MKLTSFILYLYLLLISYSNCLLCYNGTTSYIKHGEDPLQRKLLFGPSKKEWARLRCSLTVMCKEENAMCFVRSWTARARHSWIVQRGCYQTRAQDPFPKAMDTPTRAMSCRYERLAEADYKVCMCNADWCNNANIFKASFKITYIYICTSYVLFMKFLNNIKIIL